MSWWLKALAYGAGGLAVAGLAALVALQERLVYVPVLPGLPRAYAITPARLRLAYEDVWLRAADGVRLHSWFIRHSPTCRGPTILFFQENAGNIAHRLEFVRLMMERLQCNVFMLSYRGYGDSEGYPSQKGITYDAQAALDHLVERKDIDTSRIVVFGRSLGGAVGAVLAKNNPDKVSALILENTFTSILDMAGLMLPFLRWFIGGSSSKGPKLLNCVVRSPWGTLDVIGQVKQPILFLSGLQDELVPPSHMRMLYDKAIEHNKNCRFVEFPSGMHMDTWISGGNRYWRAIQLFLDHYAPEVLSHDPSCRSEIAEGDADDFFQQCDPEKENLCLYGFPNERWEVNLPAEEVPPELPEPALGINFARDGMQEKDWLSMVAVHSDAWLLSVAFYFGARFGFDKNNRKRLFGLINELPTIFEVCSGKSKIKTPSSTNHSNNKSKPINKTKSSEPKVKQPKPPPQVKEENSAPAEEGQAEEEDGSGGSEGEHGETFCGSCGESYGPDEFWICCDICEKWFHGKCVKITAAKAENMKQYKCPSCTGGGGGGGGAGNSSSKRARPS